MEVAAISTEQQLVDQLYEQVKTTIDTKVITAASAVNIITATMAMVESMCAAPGPQKKALVLHIIDRLVDEIPAEREDKLAIKNAIALLAPSIIDSIVAVSKGQVAINLPGGKACCVIC